ncbi:MAG TPA: ABC transporter permease [Deltaproteobacteria bacterium]|nr:MAG: ABC transporter permease [Deltaproteobacteria bacterium GWF2_42_12]HAG51976.1 ABC transporter permease [Deltaproteobacteria bacterium]
MNALDLKLLRDLWRMRGQAFAIVLVIVSGVATFVMLISNMDSLYLTREKYYQENEFADVFASLKRAPESIKQRIKEIPGVEQVETRVVADVKLDIEGFSEPVIAKLISIPDTGKPLLNRLYIRKGRLVDPWKDDEIVVSEAFAEAHGFAPGDRIGAIINGKWERLVIVGIALSPEFVLQARPGALSPDYKRYAILWMGRNALSTAYDMKGAFNDVTLTLSLDANMNDILIQLDNLLYDYGGLVSYGRKDQMSHRFLDEEFKQLRRSAEIFPAIFIAVATFLLNVVVSRTVSTQREQIAALKAFGYSNLMIIGMHYIKMVSLIVFIGVAGGIAVGIWFGKGLGNIYMEFYRFPYLIYELKPNVALIAALITATAAIAGTIHSVKRAATMPPAEAMRPEPPARYRKTIIDRLGIARMLSQPTLIIVRDIGRRPIKSLLTITGIAFSCAIIIAGTFSSDAVDFIVNVQFRLSQKDNMAVTFVEPVSRNALYELQGLSGVEYAEVFRTAPVRLRFGHQSFRTTLQGIEPDGHLRVLLDVNLKPFTVPSSGIVLSDYLGALLGVRQGDMITVEVLEGKRPIVQVPVAGLVEQYIGIASYMDITALNRLIKEGSAISGAYLTVDSLYQTEIYKRLVEMPRVAGAIVREDEIKNFYELQAEFFLFFTFVATILAGTIALGVVYNSARIALSERSRELASLRVLGYTRAEISYIFLGELGILTLASIPLGLFLGRGLCEYIARALSSELFRVPAIIELSTYSFAATVVVISACLSGLIVRHRLDHLDLVEVLKAKE